MHKVPHYLRFVRALAVVSATLPVPIVLVAAHLAGCSSGSSGSSGGPSLGVQACPADECGVRGVPADAAGLDAGMDAAPDGNLVGDASDGGGDSGDASDDGGGPSRGTPELPAAWLA